MTHATRRAGAPDTCPAVAPPHDAAAPRSERERGGNGLAFLAAAFLLVVLVTTAGLAVGSTRTSNGALRPVHVGSEACAGCHAAEARLWADSQHRHAMDHATEKTVRGDFADARFEHFGVVSRFFREDGRFMVETDGPDGRLATFPVKYTFGLEPLQQYLIEFPDGRIQALSVAWDTRPKERGGQRWFHLYPDEAVPHDDELHWTKRSQNWNFMCAECHSTGLRRNYDAARDRFATTWSEISVGCEACHGEGSAHLAWAAARAAGGRDGAAADPTFGLLVRFTERKDVVWTLDATTGNARRSVAPATLRKEVETCGLCHARRLQQSEDWVPGRWLSETHLVSPLAPGLYHADGQMRDEVYTYGSFKQSRMFAAGVTCSDCHDPHSGKLRLAGDATCLQCHAGDRYSAASHHRHDATPPPCVACHMPRRTYMVVDDRHDHGFRVPRPDVSVATGAPNACNDCHRDRSPAWAAAAVEAWHGPQRKGLQTYAPAFAAAWSGRADAGSLLAAVAADGGTPGFARAGALAELDRHLSPATIAIAREALRDPDPVVRIGALDMLDGVPPQQAWPLASPLLADPVRGVRIRAASLLAAVPAGQLPPAERERFEGAAAEFVAAQRLLADRPEPRAALGTFLARRGDAAAAEIEFQAALRLDPRFVPAAINLADLYRALGRDADGEAVLRAAIAASPASAGLHHALGLALVRGKRLDAAVASLTRAAELDPGNPRLAYVRAVALDAVGRRAEAIAVLDDNHARHPRDRDTLTALVGFHQAAGDWPRALAAAERLAALDPGDRRAAQWLEAIRQRAKRP